MGLKSIDEYHTNQYSGRVTAVIHSSYFIFLAPGSSITFSITEANLKLKVASGVYDCLKITLC